MSISPQDIQNREFRESFRGYNEDDVDTFLDQVAEEFGRLYQENQRIRIQLASAQQELARLGERGRVVSPTTTSVTPPARAPMPAAPQPAGAPGSGKAEAREEMKRALVATQRAAEAALDEAKRRAADIIARAEQRAREIDEMTARRAKEVDSDAGSALTHAQRRVEELQHQEAEIRLRLRRMLAEHVRVLQQLEGGEPVAPRTGKADAPEPISGAQASSGAPRSPVVEQMERDLGTAAETPPRKGIWRS